jgi:hypothetical protein
MRDAEEEFRCFAVRVNRDFPCFYTLDDIEQVCSIVRQHDNPGVKKHGEPLQFSYDPPARRLIWSHREADRLWMLDKAGFALDLLRRLLEPNPWYDPPQYLNHVISSHLKEAETYHDNGSCIDFGGRKSMYRSNAGFGIFRRLVGERAAEFGVAV